MIALAIVGRTSHRSISELLEISDEDKAFGLMLDMKAAYELLRLDDVREERRLLRLTEMLMLIKDGLMTLADTDGPRITKDTIIEQAGEW